MVMLKFHLGASVYEKALDRIRWCFDNFPSVHVGWSGGKDSTVVLELALKVAAERGIARLPVKWLDQECEFQATVDLARDVFSRPTVDPHWLQVPFRLSNATSGEARWLNVWGEGETWVREKDPGTLRTNCYGTDRFHTLLAAADAFHWPGGCCLTGIRLEESPTRRAGLTHWPTVKWVTWGRKDPSGNVALAPIYDWDWRDVWKAIHDHGWAYNAIYDAQYRYGIPPRDMRVSNYHHETAVGHLRYLQEVEPETYEKATARLAGISTAAHLGDDFFVDRLPFMFGSWVEYRDFLLARLIVPEHQEKFRVAFAAYDRRLPNVPREKLGRVGVATVLANDLDFTKLNNFFVANHQGAALLARQAAQEAPGEPVGALT